MHVHPDSESNRAALARVIASVTDDALFAFAFAVPVVADGLGKRRGEVYAQCWQAPTPSLALSYDSYYVTMVRALAALGALNGLPMGDLFGARITLEAGARGLRSLFSSKPSEKDTQRVRRIGTLATRVLRSVQEADGPANAEESLQLQALVHGLGLEGEESDKLLGEAATRPEDYELYGDLEPDLTRAITRGAWLAALADGLDNREDLAVRTIASKLGLSAEDIENARNQTAELLERRRQLGLACLEGLRFVLADADPSRTHALSFAIACMVLPPGNREEGLAPIRQGTPVTLGKRFRSLPDAGKAAALAMVWAAALGDAPDLVQLSLRRALHDRVARDLNHDGARLRGELERYLDEVVQPFAEHAVKS